MENKDNNNNNNNNNNNGYMNNDSNSNNNPDSFDSNEMFNSLDLDEDIVYSSDILDDLGDFPQINLETDDLIIELTLTKDYSKFKDHESRKIAFKKDIKEFFDEFYATEEFNELIDFYSEK
ncbi:hypothetical protein [Methanobrevibacter curvatus]|uniref:Uncharacterized protein n=1 Tax=Methanobrevibacter curvatus TaxID=49547 RepID=A0A165ZQ34_9EURY|nr:hypothetical protein [Methanobrevibacter curvatus]KZX11012.1 hypothetical protein MBCUR_15980 [Methanobrevibacter curvatus]